MNIQKFVSLDALQSLEQEGTTLDEMQHKKINLVKSFWNTQINF